MFGGNFCLFVLSKIFNFAGEFHMQKNSVSVVLKAFVVSHKSDFRRFIAWAYFLNIQLMIYLNFFQRTRLGCRYGKTILEEELIIVEPLPMEA
jgi:hypothetical protein